MINQRISVVLVVTGLILLANFIAMQFTSEVNWTLGDFVAAGILLLAAGLTLEFILRKVTRLSHRILLVLAVLTVFALVWIELAVGIFGSPFAGS
ncbi:MAG: hypothetical protein LCH54_17080 [Bacteroidetes bacterium]|nr:hypothetical protein [Bacteroidota bacterium]